MATQKQAAPPPLKGLYDGLDSALDDSVFPAGGASQLVNVRVGAGQWETRAGMTLWRTVASNLHFLGSVIDSSGRRYRLAAAGGTLADWEEDGGDVAWQPVSGGTGLAQNRLHGVQLGNNFYFTDQSGALRKYLLDPTSTVSTVTQPAKPTAAPSVRPAPYGYLEDWASVASWIPSDAAHFPINLASAGSNDPLPEEGNSARLTVKNGSQAGMYIAEDTTGEAVPSNYLACWGWAGAHTTHVQLRLGAAGKSEVMKPFHPPKLRQIYPLFLNLGGLDTVRFKHFVLTGPNQSGFDFFVYFSRLTLTGRLGPGTYRWAYTHYNPTTGAESPLSDGSAPADFSAVGIDYRGETAGAFNQTALLGFVSDTGTDASTTRIRVYRSGGVPSLTVDELGRTVWIKVAELVDYASTISCTAGLNTGTVASATGLAVGDWVLVDRASSVPEFNKVTAIAGTTVTFRDNWIASHAVVSVQMAYQDNTPDEQLDVTARIEPERDNATAGSLWVAKSTDDRIWLFGPGDQVQVSNRATPDRPIDYEVFPAGVDPLTRRSLLQGWRFNIGGRLGGEELMWGGMFNGLPTVLTRTGLYQITAYSQATWGPESVVKVFDSVGCAAGETVQEVNGSLYWVSLDEVPRLMRWDGRGAPAAVSTWRVNTALENAMGTHVSAWHAIAHTKRDGLYYCLWVTPDGGSSPTLGLQYNVERDYWETVTYYRSGVLMPVNLAHVQHVGADRKQLFAGVAGDGAVFQLDDADADDDAGDPIHVAWTTKRFALGLVSQIERFFFRLEGVDDALSVTVKTGGSEYGDVVTAFNTLNVDGTGDVEVEQRCDFDLQKGRWVEFACSGQVHHGPAVRELDWHFTPIRDNPVSH